ncbi:hypothetical protein VZT92_014567 [Zoarces viviparus]|uniref:Uncharacterized protein n=1 Tax=Zoarces viviparus TaxID=48416 RepID=A0AAW1F112_ZOAVI
MNHSADEDTGSPLMFGEDASGELLERRPTTLKTKIIQQCRKLPSISELEEHLLATGPPEDGTEVSRDSDLSSVLLLLHLIPPSAPARKKPGKVSASQAEKHLVAFNKTGPNIQSTVMPSLPALNTPPAAAAGGMASTTSSSSRQEVQTLQSKRRRVAEVGARLLH